MATQKNRWSNWHTITMIACLTAIAVALTLLVWNGYRLPGWYASLAGFTVMTLIVGHGVTGKGSGALINSQNRYSLSQLQIVLWTLLILSAVSTAAVSRAVLIQQGKAPASADPKHPRDPSAQANDVLDYSIPSALWALMGIAITSAVASPLILQNNKDKPVSTGAVAGVTRRLTSAGEPAPEVQGQVVIRPDSAPPRLSDLFQGEEPGNAGFLDVTRLQNLYITAVILFAYGFTLHTLFQGNGWIHGLPDVSTGMVALLGISHAGYLTAKAGAKGAMSGQTVAGIAPQPRLGELAPTPAENGAQAAVILDDGTARV